MRFHDCNNFFCDPIPIQGPDATGQGQNNNPSIKQDSMQDAITDDKINAIFDFLNIIDEMQFAYNLQ